MLYKRDSSDLEFNSLQRKMEETRMMGGYLPMSMMREQTSPR
jgi:hypothetical protein